MDDTVYVECEQCGFAGDTDDCIRAGHGLICPDCNCPVVEEKEPHRSV